MISNSSRKRDEFEAFANSLVMESAAYYRTWLYGSSFHCVDVDDETELGSTENFASESEDSSIASLHSVVSA